MRILALLNCAAGAGSQKKTTDREAEVRDAFAQAGIEAQVRAVDGQRIISEAQAAKETVDVLAAAGGDGTISSIASVMAGSGKTMGVLPCGTLNHFAKDLHIPLELHEAARVVAHGTPRAVDVGEVNGRVFVNNSSIGLYPHVVESRDRQMERLGRGKWMSMLRAWLSVFRRYPTVSVRMINDAGQSITCQTPFVFIGNNRYEIDHAAWRAHRARSRRTERLLHPPHRTIGFGLARDPRIVQPPGSVARF
ncbi:MAG: diacylglycerol kinase family lipid kinase [Anaerolineae bacterium]|nr:diacylglycerol kinase family lipid kinase [Phycisphaerae bacterium]